MSRGFTKSSPAHSKGDSMTSLTGVRFYGDNWGKPRPIMEPQGQDGECIVKTPADPEKLAKYRKELAERNAKYGNNNHYPRRQG